jgi:uracil-DNA glycosylase family 4
VGRFVDELARARIGTTFNQYAAGSRAPLLRARLAAYLEARDEAAILLVGEAPGYRGARVSGVPFTSERQLTGSGPAEASATIVHRALDALGLEEDVLLWNVVPTHPGTERGNRPPTAREVRLGMPFAERLARGRTVVAVGRVAAGALGARYVRHPSHGGAAAFRDGLALLHSRAGGHPTAVSCA